MCWKYFCLWLPLGLRLEEHREVCQDLGWMHKELYWVCVTLKHFPWRRANNHQSVWILGKKAPDKFSEGKKNKKLKYFYCFKTLVFYIWAKMFNSFIEKHSTSDNIIYEWTVNNYFAQKKKTLLLVLQASRYYSKFVFISTINNFYIYLWSNFATLFSLLIFNLGCS